jgi:hypothetical protein
MQVRALCDLLLREMQALSQHSDAATEGGPEVLHDLECCLAIRLQNIDDRLYCMHVSQRRENWR